MSLRLPCCCSSFQRVFHLSTRTQICDQGQNNQMNDLTPDWTESILNLCDFTQWLTWSTQLNCFTNSFSKSNRMNRWNHLAEWQKASFKSVINKRGITRHLLNTNGPPTGGQITGSFNINCSVKQWHDWPTSFSNSFRSILSESRCS